MEIFNWYVLCFLAGMVFYAVVDYLSKKFEARVEVKQYDAVTYLCLLDGCTFRHTDTDVAVVENVGRVHRMHVHGEEYENGNPHNQDVDRDESAG